MPIDPADYWIIYGNAGLPVMHNVPIYPIGCGKTIFVIECTCEAKNQYRLGNGRSVMCQSCERIWCRIGQRIIGYKTNSAQEFIDKAIKDQTTT